MRTLAILSLFIFLFGISAVAIEEKVHVQDNGGGTISGGGYSNLASIGQTVICMSSGGTYENCAGFIGSLMGTSMSIEEKPGEDPGNKLPEKFSVGSAYPNPFNSSARFNIYAPQGGLMIVRFYDLTGRMVFGENKDVATGEHVLNFEAGALPGGTYLYSISMGEMKFTGKIVLVK